MKILPKLIITLCVCLVVIGSGYYFLLTPQFKQDRTVVAISTLGDQGFGWRYPTVKFPQTGAGDLAYSDIRDPGGIPQGLPVRLKIPVIGVNSAIEDALITPDGRMDVPSGSVDVAWFALGPHPGQVGSAVIGGHFGINNGVKFVFFDLDKLKVGDKVYIEDDRGDTLAFQVRSIALFDRDADATTVFTSTDGLAHLNIITCEGFWNKVNDSYPQRRVVFTDAIPSEGAVTVNVNLPSAGVSKQLTRTELISETISPAPTSTLEQTPVSVIQPNLFMQSVKNLFRTPIDGLITSILFFAIIVVLFKILR